ncbi:ATP/GTP-binding protein [Plantibacter sp. CFBP 13570]|uniref:ATP/GTP-binding protein n=1 Tax=Plantibacter sp. CFBP 13570 TaxID=2775272 RepID=UPI001930A6A8|nr:ATP/GTP-binding protein [Plantibacter sp. CFBP 13570]MBD8537122.1 ATP/GTP-binding protein [Plantibacter sp. CFBP 13570]
MPWVLGDVKNEYAALIRSLGGEVFAVAPGKAGINVLDVSQALDAANKLLAAARTQLEAGAPKRAGELQDLAAKVLAAAHARRKNMVASLITIARGSKPAEHEEMIIDQAIRLLDRTHPGTPIMGDLLALVKAAPAELRAAAVDGGRIERYREKTEKLEVSLTGLTGSGVFGDTFAGQTSMTLDRSRPVSFDLSGIDQTQTELRAAALMASWSYGFGVVDAANALADAGLEPQRNYLIIMDEMWQALRAGEGMVDRLDAITRLNRMFGIGMLFITHAIGDFYALSSAADVQKAREFINRASLLFIGGITDTEIPRLEEIVDLSRREKARLKSWNDPGPLDPATGTYGDPPGRGKFLLKAGNNAGVPFQMHLVPAEIPLNDTNQRFSRSTTKQEAA